MKLLNAKNALLVIVTISLFACKKDGGGNSNSSLAGNVKTKIETYQFGNGPLNSDTFDFSYDSQIRLTTMVARSGKLKFNYTYLSNNITKFDMYETGNVLSIHEDYFNNSNGTIDSTFQYNNTKDSSTEKYTYNSSNQLIKLQRYDYSINGGSIPARKDEYTYDAIGNMISDKEYFQSTLNNIETYSYTNYSNSFLIGTTWIQPFSTKLPLQKIKSFPTSTDIYTSDFSYIFDSNNRVATETQKVSRNGTLQATAINYYTYY